MINPEQSPVPKENNETELLEEFYELAIEACQLIRQRLPELSEHMPGEDPLEEVRFAFRHLATDEDATSYESEREVKERMAAIKELMPTIPLQ